eukprot:TRINITY_DN5774_c0_g1_i1.p1 TRINITY_DN5774_c0_g1~~TRINITY_DN5774_c0_g1_i1.p1  ORF type:complete len:251 (+),score=40.94 TRINITY_DN5774_c0_g1_i1:75-827(+)
MATMMPDVENQMKADNRAAQLRGISREQTQLGFIRKVYGIVCLQIAATAAVAALFVGPLRSSILSFVVQSPRLFNWGTVISSLVALVALQVCKKNYPVNLYILGAFTLIMSLNVGVVCAMVSEVGLGHLVVQAALITALLTCGLTLYAFKSKRDFSFLGAVLFPLLFALSMFGLLSLFFPSLRTGVTGLMYSFAGAVIFCLYIVFDTYRILHSLKVDDYVEGAIQLYLDIINLFMYVLEILIKLSAKERR